MTMLIDIKNTDEKISTNFTHKEFFTKDPNYNKPSHKLDKRLIDAVQYIRTKFNTRIRINSSYRSPEYNASIGGAKKSFHMEGRAIDFTFIGDNNKALIADVEKDINAKGEIFKTLTGMGVNGILFYNTFIHLDTRDVFYTKKYI